ncbi:unnamed protein product [Arctogadus glacialis]
MNPEPLLTVYFLPLTYGFMVTSEETPFSYSLAVDASLHDVAKAITSPVEPNFRHTVSCYYLVNETETLEFDHQPLVNIPPLVIGTGQLMVEMSLWQPAYFESALLHSANPQLELILDNCWAALQEERTSLPRWDIIVGSCENLEDRYVTTFHPVVSDQRVVVPSLCDLKARDGSGKSQRH